jgi:hypothetical protein
MNRPNDPARQRKRFGGESVPTPRVGSRYAASIRVGCVPQSRRYCVMTRALLAIALTAALTGCAVADVARYQAVLDDFAATSPPELVPIYTPQRRPWSRMLGLSLTRKSGLLATGTLREPRLAGSSRAAIRICCR